MKDSLSFSLPGLAVWSSSAVMVPIGETEFVCECGAVTDSVTIAEDVFAGIFSLLTQSSCEKMMLQLTMLSSDAGVSLSKMFLTP